jgi:DNA-binding MarR family transcriptional regulator
MSDESHQNSGVNFTDKQGQYLAFIHAYTCINLKAPAESDLLRHFRVTPPTVHQMILTLERAGLIARQPGKARSIQIAINPEMLPVLQCFPSNPSNPL